MTAPLIIITLIVATTALAIYDHDAMALAMFVLLSIFCIAAMAGEEEKKK